MDLVFTWSISFSYKRKSTPRVRSASFGDGYEQRVPDGINNNPAMWDVVVQGPPQCLDAPEKFLDDRAGSDAFYWVSPRGQLLRVVCRSYERDDSTAANGTITGTFEQVFDGSLTADSVGLMFDNLPLGTPSTGRTGRMFDEVLIGA